MLAIDQDMEVINEIKDKVTYAVRADSTDERALKSLGLDKMDVAIVSIGTHFENTLLTSVLLKQMKVKKVYARVTSKIQNTILKKMGVDEIISPEFEVAKRLSRIIMSDVLKDYVELDEDYNIVEIKAPKSFIGRSLQELDLRIRFNVNLITIKRPYKVKDENTDEEIRKERIYGVPTATTIIERDDTLIVLGRDKDIAKIMD